MQIAIITTCGRLGSFVCHRAVQTQLKRHSQLFSKLRLLVLEQDGEYQSDKCYLSLNVSPF